MVFGIYYDQIEFVGIGKFDDFCWYVVDDNGLIVFDIGVGQCFVGGFEIFFVDFVQIVFNFCFVDELCGMMEICVVMYIDQSDFIVGMYICDQFDGVFDGVQ